MSDFTVTGSGAGRLNRGELAARVSKQARGFTIDTPSASIVDLGTEFGVAVEADRATQVEVFEGIVQLQSRQHDTQYKLTTGMTVRATASGQVTVNGDVSVPNLRVGHKGTVAVMQSLTSTGTFDLRGGTIDGPGDLTVTGAFNWSGGSIRGDGTMNLPANSDSKFGRVVLVHSVRHPYELTYRDEIAGIAHAHAGAFDYVPMVSRESHRDALAGRIPQAIDDGRLEARVGLSLTPENAHAMLCGNPAMVDDVQKVLGTRGMRRHRRKEPGHITLETYW